MRTSNSPSGKGTRDQILAATLDFIRGEGLASLTIRAIAKQAGVNVAAVNYHFGSKEALINEVLLTLTAGLRNAFVNLTDEGAPPRARLHRFFDALSSAVQEHPEVYRHALGLGLASFEAQQQYFGFLRSDGMKALRSNVREATGEANEQRLMLRIAQAVGGLVYPLLVDSFLEQVAGVRLSDEAVRRAHVEVCLDALTGPEPAKPRKPARKKRPRRG